MTVPPAQQRAQSAGSVYAPLSPSTETDIAARNPQSPSTSQQVSRLAAEAQRLEQIKTALWEAFRSSHPAAIPMPLVDLATAYASLLRLEMTVASGAVPPRAVTVSRVTPEQRPAKQLP